MMFTKDHGNGGIQLVVPVVMCEQLLSSYHDSVLSRHRGKTQMLNAISKTISGEEWLRIQSIM